MNKELPCHVCGKSTPINELKAFPGLKWVCTQCSQRTTRGSFRSEFARPLVQERKEVFVDPFNEEKRVQQASIPKSTQERSWSVIQPKKEPKEKILYKCSRCRFESRQTKEDAVCPNCGREGTLMKVASASEILKDVEEKPFFFPRKE